MRGSHYSCFRAKGDGDAEHVEVSAPLPICNLDCSYHTHDRGNPQPTYTTLDDDKSQPPLIPTPLSLYLSVYLSIRQSAICAYKMEIFPRRTNQHIHSLTNQSYRSYRSINHIDQTIKSNQIRSDQSVYERGKKREGRKEGTLFQFFHLTLIKPLRVLGWSGFKLPPRLALYCAPRGNGGRNRWNDWGMAHGQTDFQTSYLSN